MTTQVPEVPLWLGMGCGFLVALVALALSLREWRPARLAIIFKLTRHIALPIGISALVLVAIDLLFGLSGMRATILLTPIVAFMWLFIKGRPKMVEAGHTVWIEIGLLGNTMWLFAASITMGAVLTETPVFLGALGHMGLAAFPSPVIFAMIGFIPVGLAVAGFHPTIIGSVLVAITTGVDGRIEPLVVFMLILFGWHCGVILSVSSMSVAIVQRDFMVPLTRLAAGQNLVFALLCSSLISFTYLIWTVTTK
ncbi:hypothetical protein G5B38_20740 (plasmid) [Pseudohalocynthiibacter aestuariivivens]|nr:hypothetical protein [Pseudohalocynthiibacter aestuariivivens]QIE48038.1 hypothetical protein G5B38_20740 [Pseudohalocynthiibacter aestuariivivens]